MKCEWLAKNVDAMPVYRQTDRLSDISVVWPPDAVYVLCYSLILLSIDLSSPHVKNKMSKREFIRNTRRAAHNVSDDFVGHLYDNIYLIGHVAA